jgi:hypothetical protein
MAKRALNMHEALTKDEGGFEDLNRSKDIDSCLAYDKVLNIISC